ncbi:enoyl-CoA hydratase/isomerase family protein [Solimonas sp. SE-A11]|uniref:enoyl-CoA hydratase/isomerase family protein n=1 Tax=Solimonas sp. SE-A11 TaxID=3054954 RepID=UPI00259C790C|nr:enoyl-CoA hydratase-related protein [Solimonas sp. SE-A11]MDM4771441.1 enoyl-CoA hydratase-related protein [Solimonas sp. SE-A11]
MTEHQELLYSVEDGIATVTLNRPERRNALSPQVTHILADTWKRIDADPGVRVAILTSSYCGTFCAGMDLREAARLKIETGKDILEFFADLRNDGIGKVRKPLIAAINGHFPAGGMMLALNCDLRVGLAGTRGGITEVKIGRGSPWAVPLLWMMPQAQLMETVLTGEMLPAERLYAVGFLNYLEDSDAAVQARARELARKIADAAPRSVMAGKKALKDATTLGCEPGLQAAWDYYERHVYPSEDAIEGPKAFAEKRKPQWKGR